MKVIVEKVITTFWLPSVEKTQESENWDEEQTVEELYWSLEELKSVSTRDDGLLWVEKGVIRKKLMIPDGLLIVVRMVYLVVEVDDKLKVLAIKVGKEAVPFMVIVGTWLLDSTTTPVASTIDALNDPVTFCSLGLVTEDIVAVPIVLTVALMLISIVWVVVP